MLNLDEIMSPM